MVGSVGGGILGILIRWYSKRIVVAAQTEKDAEEPRPAPTGSVARALKLNEGLMPSSSGGTGREECP